MCIMASALVACSKKAYDYADRLVRRIWQHVKERSGPTRRFRSAMNYKIQSCKISTLLISWNTVMCRWALHLSRTEELHVENTNESCSKRLGYRQATPVIRAYDPSLCLMIDKNDDQHHQLISGERIDIDRRHPKCFILCANKTNPRSVPNLLSLRNTITSMFFHYGLVLISIYIRHVAPWLYIYKYRLE